MNVHCELLLCPEAPEQTRFFLLTGPKNAMRKDLRNVGREQLQMLAKEFIPAGGSLKETPTGPVGCGSWSTLSFSISYARNHMLIGIALGWNLGVDILELQSIPEWRGISALYFSPKTRERLEAETEDHRLNSFCAAWTILEADLKCLGLGLSEHNTVAIQSDKLLHLQPRVPAGFCATASMQRRMPAQ